MTSAAFPITDTIAASIKCDVKAALRMQRKPRHLKVFWYFLWCWKRDQGKINTTPTTTTIDGRLTNWTTPRTVILKDNLKMIEPDYAPWFDNFCVWRLGGAWNYVNGQVRQMKRWSDAADALFSKWSHLEVPEAVEQQFYPQTRPTAPHLHSTIDGRLRSFYHTTVRSPHRWYHPLQNLPSEELRGRFPGCVNVDIVSCYASIWWHELGGRDCELERAWLLNPQHKDQMYRILMQDFNLATTEEAKTLRTTLTSDYRNGHRYTSGVEWFDALHNRILEDAYRWAREHGMRHPTAHKVFTHFEATVVQRMVQAGDEVLLMHDGVVFKDVDARALKAAAAPHIVKIEQW